MTFFVETWSVELEGERNFIMKKIAMISELWDDNKNVNEDL